MFSFIALSFFHVPKKEFKDWSSSIHVFFCGINSLSENLFQKGGLKSVTNIVTECCKNDKSYFICIIRLKGLLVKYEKYWTLSMYLVWHILYHKKPVARHLKSEKKKILDNEKTEAVHLSTMFLILDYLIISGCQITRIILMIAGWELNRKNRKMKLLQIIER